MSLSDVLKNHIIIVVLGTAVTAFGAGWAAYKAVLEAGGQELILKTRKNELEDKVARLDSCLERPPAAECPPIPPVASERTVVLVDTADTSKAYSRTLRENSHTNAHFLRTALSSYRLPPNTQIRVELIGQDQSDSESILDHNPQLIVVHRSTFGPDDHVRADEGIIRLVSRLDPGTSVLIYSRKQGTDSRYASSILRRAGGRVTVDAIQLDEGDAWAKYDQVIGVLRRVAELVQ